MTGNSSVHNTAINSTASEKFKDKDENIHAILEERDAEASFFLLGHPMERNFMDNLLETTRMQVLARMEIIGNSLIQLEENDNLADRRTTWKKKQKVVGSAMELLDAFVPVHYQSIDKYRLIRKFYGAMLEIAAGNVSRTHSIIEAYTGKG